MNLQERIRAALAACDPLGRIKQGAPQDEYDDEADDISDTLCPVTNIMSVPVAELCKSVFEVQFDVDLASRIDYDVLSSYVLSAYRENKFIPDGVKVLFFPHLEEYIRKYGNCLVHVVKELGWDQRDPGETPRMFEVVFPDGETGHACEEELITKTWSYNGDKTY